MKTNSTFEHICRAIARREGIELTPAGEPLFARDLPRWHEIRNAPTPRNAGDPPASLMDYDTNAFVRDASEEELAASRAAGEMDGGRGVITVDGRRCYAQD